MPGLEAQGGWPRGRPDGRAARGRRTSRCHRVSPQPGGVGHHPSQGSSSIPSAATNETLGSVRPARLPGESSLSGAGCLGVMEPLSPQDPPAVAGVAGGSTADQISLKPCELGPGITGLFVTVRTVLS